MDKKMLKAIPVKKFESVIETLTNLKHTYIINAYITKRILVMDIYSTNGELQFRIFQTKKEFITLEGNKWRKSKLINLFNWYFQPTFITTSESKAAIKKYLKTDEEPIDAVKSLQEAIRKAELDNRHKAELDWIDEHMKPVRAVPGDFKRWINDEALIKSRYIIYEYSSRKMMKGICTHCHAEVLVEKPKHNAEGACPSCKSTVIYKAKGKANNIVDKCTVQLLQKHPEGVVIREFSAEKRYFSSGDSNLTYSENNRTIVGKEILYFAWDNYKNSGICRWCSGSWGINPGPLYTRNLKKALSGTEFKYSGLTEIASSHKNVSAIEYLRTYQLGPALEYLSKLKLHNLVISVLYKYKSSYRTGDIVNLKGRNPKEVLKISTEGLNRAIKLNVSMNELRLLQISEREGVHIPDEIFKDVAEDFGYYYEDLIKISKLSTLHQLLKYLKNKKVNFGDYRDYISMAKKLNWNIEDSFILFPRHFKQAHDQAQSLVKVKESYAENLIIKKMYEDLNKQLSFSSEEYSIRLPMSAKEIIREGHELHHCVGNYIQNVAKGKTLILLIRKKANPFSPYYTLELDPKEKNIKQVRGKSNCNPDEDITKLLENYKKNIDQIKLNIAC